MESELTSTAARPIPTESAEAEARMLAAGERAFCLADWSRALFVHYAIDPAVLQPHVPFALDLFEGNAYVSLVAFAQKNVRPLFAAAFGRLARRVAARCAKPVAEHAFLNLRTYVRHLGEPAIYFLAEWIDNRIDRVVGPATYGLPYRLASLRYHYDGEGRPAGGGVTDGHRAFRFDATVDCAARFTPAAPGLDSFLLERSTAFTRRGPTCRRFRISHAPWPQARATVTARATSLLDRAAPWFGACQYAGANFSPGVNDVRIGWPHEVRHAPTPVEPGRPGPSLTATVMTLLASMPVVTLSMGAPRWALMWSIAFALFFACKWVTWRRAGRQVGVMRSLAYLFAWVGMDAPAFLDRTRTPRRPARPEWPAPSAKATAGAALVWGAARLAFPNHPIAAGWVGMVGLALLLHFGTFHLLALLWSRAGVDAAPIMQQPARSRSLAEFWSVRWNRGFHDLAQSFVFRPALRLGLRPRTALLATFVASGLVHESVISLPAGAGWGLPTMYFTLQGLGVLFERSDLGRRFGLTSGLRGRLFTFACTILPLPWLFHAPFVRRVALPFLQVLGAFQEVPAMTAQALSTLLLLGGVCHFGILIASALVPRVLDWKGELKSLSPLSRHLVWTHGAFIVVVILAFGLISVANAADLASGSILSRWVTGFIAAFWLARLGIQLFLFDAKPFLTSRFLKLGYHGLTVVFAYLGLVYAWAALLPRATTGGAL